MKTTKNKNWSKLQHNNRIGNSRVLAVCDYVCCAFLSLALSASSYYTTYGDCPLSVAFVLTALLVFAVLILITFCLRKFLTSKVWQSKKFSNNRISNFANRLLNCKHPVLAVASVILVCWALPLIFLYPGTCINDTWNQLHQYMTFFSNGGMNVDGQITDHHPIFDTFFIGFLIVPLAQATGLWHPVMFCYVLLQAICTSLAFSCTVNYANKKLKLGIVPTYMILIAFCCMQVFPAMVQLISKDSLHSWIFVFYVLFFIELVRTNGKVIKNKKFTMLFCATIVFCCLTKKVGFYVILLSLLLFLIFCKNNRKFVLIPMLCAILLMQGAVPLALNGMDITAGSKREMLSLPFMMTARYVKDYPQDVTDAERAVIDKTLQYDTLAERYKPIFADPVKNYSNIEGMHGFIDYFKVWVKQGFRHPDAYVKAANCLIAGWFSWDEWAPLMNNGWRDQFNESEIPAYVPERGITQVTADGYQEFMHNLYKFPILRVFHTFAFWASLILAFAVCTVIRFRKTQKASWMALLPCLFALFLGCWLSPVSNYGIEGIRYLFPVVETAPLMLAWCFYLEKNKKAKCLKKRKWKASPGKQICQESQF